MTPLLAIPDAYPSSAFLAFRASRCLIIDNSTVMRSGLIVKFLQAISFSFGMGAHNPISKWLTSLRTLFSLLGRTEGKPMCVNAHKSSSWPDGVTREQRPSAVGREVELERLAREMKQAYGDIDSHSIADAVFDRGGL